MTLCQTLQRSHQRCDVTVRSKTTTLRNNILYAIFRSELCAYRSAVSKHKNCDTAKHNC